METRLSRVQRLFLLLLLILLAQPAAAQDLQERCALVQPIADVKFNGRVLRSTPDIKEQALRKADALLSARCYELYQQVVEDYLAKHPDDEHVWFLHARQAWLFGQVPRSKAMMTAALAKRPSFTSMKVLQASLAIDENRLEDAQTLLAQVEKEQPRDLWLFMDRLRLEALLIPSAATTRSLLAVLENPAFPGSARETAARSLQQVRNQSLDVLERAYREQLTFESATPYEMKARNLAFFLIHIAGKPAQAHALLEPMLAAQDRELQESARGLQVDAYLMEAAQPAVTDARRRELVNEAGKAVGNDWTLVEYRLAQQPELLATLQQYLPEGAVAESTDKYGRTMLCNAVMTMNVAAVQAALRRGGDANGDCDGTTHLEYVLRMGWGGPTAEDEAPVMQGMVRALLEAGAKQPRYTGDCTPACRKYLLPILQQHGFTERP
jgi:hypothetical protein